MENDEITRIRIGKHPTGIIGLKAVLLEVAETLAGAPDSVIEDALIQGVSRSNYIAAGARDLYGGALLRAYKKHVGEPFAAQTGAGIEIRVLGMGCPRCDRLEQDLMAMVAEMGIEADLEHVRDPAEIGRYGVMGSPALVIDGEVKSVGKVPTRNEIKAWLKEASSKT